MDLGCVLFQTLSHSEGTASALYRDAGMTRLGRGLSLQGRLKAPQDFSQVVEGWGEGTDKRTTVPMMEEVGEIPWDFEYEPLSKTGHKNLPL